MSILTVPSPRITNPNICRRRGWHDYSRPGIYLVTLVRNEEVMRFSEFRDSPQPDRKIPELDLLPNGMYINSALASLQTDFNGVTVIAKTILPDYVSFIVRNNSVDKLSLDDIIFRLKKECNERYLGHDGVIQDMESADYLTSLFVGGFDDRIARRKSDVDRFVRLIERGPADYLYLRCHPEFARRFTFPTSNGRRFEGLGNALLLTDPQISAVRVSSKYSDDELLSRKQDWFRTILNGGVLVSPFVSGAESKVKRWALDTGGRVIILLPNGFGQNFHPHPSLLPALEGGRLLLIAPTEVNPGFTRPDRSLCMKMNETAEMIAAHTFIPNRI